MSNSILGAIIGGVLGGVLLSILVAILAYCGLKQKWCSRKISQTTPVQEIEIGQDNKVFSLSFKRASESDKRRSMKEF